MFQWLLCLLYVLDPAVACIKSVEMFQNLSHLPYVFDSVLACAKPAHARVSEALLPALHAGVYPQFLAFSHGKLEAG